MEQKLLNLVATANSYLADYILIALLVGVGLYFSIRTKFVQVRCFGYGMKKVFGNIKLSGGKNNGGLSSFQALATAIAGFFVSVMNRQKINLMNKMLYTVAESFVGAICGLLLVHFGIGQNIDMVMIGTIMLLIPGLAFGNAVRDLLFGDTVSGIIQLVQAVLTAVMVAFGYIVAIMFFGRMF